MHNYVTVIPPIIPVLYRELIQPFSLRLFFLSYLALWLINYTTQQNISFLIGQ